MPDCRPTSGVVDDKVQRSCTNVHGTALLQRSSTRTRIGPLQYDSIELKVIRSDFNYFNYELLVFIQKYVHQRIKLPALLPRLSRGKSDINTW